MKRVFMYEHLSGGAVDGEAAVELRADGAAMRDAVAADLRRVPGLQVACVDDASDDAKADADRGSAIDIVSRAASRHDAVWVIAPETGGLLLQLRRAVGAARWLGCSAAAIEIASSKLATLRRLAAHAVATPLAFDGDARHGGWVVKPDDGAGAIDTRRHTSRAAAEADLAERTQRGQPATLEAWVDGAALSLSLLCGRARCELLSVNRQQVEADADGMLHFHGVSLNTLPRDDPRWQALQQLARQVDKAIGGLRGFVGIDLVWHAQRGPVVIEINPRVTCAYVGLSALLGRNLAAEVIATHAAEIEHVDA